MGRRVVVRRAGLLFSPCGVSSLGNVRWTIRTASGRRYRTAPDTGFAFELPSLSASCRAAEYLTLMLDGRGRVWDIRPASADEHPADYDGVRVGGAS